MLLAEYLLKPLAEHSFLLKAISKLYLASTVEKDLFKQKTSKKVKRKQQRTQLHLKSFNKGEISAIKTNRFIKLSAW